MGGDNLYIRKDGSRECRQCSRDRSKRGKPSAQPVRLSLREPAVPRDLKYEPVEE